MASNIPLSPNLLNGANPECENPSPPDDLRDIQGFHAIEVPDWLWWLLGIILLSFLAYWIYNRFFKKPPPEVLTKYQQVVRDLASLDVEMNPKEFYLTLTEISRSYFEEELAVAALDRTIDEFLPSLRAHELVHSSQALLIKDIFERGDLAKFAQAAIGVEDKKRDQSAIISLITEINTAKEIKLAAERAKLEAALELDHEDEDDEPERAEHDHRYNKSKSKGSSGEKRNKGRLK